MSNFYYNKSIIFELNLNPTYVKIIIKKNNVVECSNKKIKSDIEKKLEKLVIKIDQVEFYVSEYDYREIELDVYWETIKNLDLENLPIYRRKDDLEEYLVWIEKNFNNNKTRIYETSKFTKRKHIFESDEKEKCTDSVKWEQTNKKFSSFSQLFYHAGDMEDIERFGYLYIRTIYPNPKSINLTDTNVFKSTNLEIWDKYDFDFESIKNTMFYMFFKMKKGILVGIKNNKLAIFLPFSNNKYSNDFYTELYFDEKDKKNLEEYKKNKNEFIKKKIRKHFKILFK